MALLEKQMRSLKEAPGELGLMLSPLWPCVSRPALDTALHPADVVAERCSAASHGVVASFSRGDTLTQALHGRGSPDGRGAPLCFSITRSLVAWGRRVLNHSVPPPAPCIPSPSMPTRSCPAPGGLGWCPPSHGPRRG